MKMLYPYAMLLLILSQSAHAQQVAGVEFQPKIQVENGQELVLQGAGVRRKFLFNIYACALYAPQGTTLQNLSNAGVRKRLVMHFTYKEVSGDKLKAGFIEGIDANHKPEWPVLQSRVDKFNGLFSTVYQGDIITLDFVPGKGVQVRLKDTIIGEISGDDFAQAVLDIWLGPNPVNAGLKQQLTSGL